MIMIDYIQLMSSGKRNPENRQAEISEITRKLKIIAKEINVPVIALSQLPVRWKKGRIQSLCFRI